MHMDVLDRDLLLALATMAVKRLDQSRVGARELVGLVQVIAPALEGLLADHGASVAFHRGAVCGDELRRDHARDFILRSNSDQSRDGRVVLPLAHFLIGMLDPERLKRLVAENVVPVVGPMRFRVSCKSSATNGVAFSLSPTGF